MSRAYDLLGVPRPLNRIPRTGRVDAGPLLGLATGLLLWAALALTLWSLS